ncbi:hypothetical protein T4D_4685 [Trichinella pseudospiralis]|uniref:Uncharacterized protein n=1 Tax=Trichinella pseudospiralis TaxID=6337 RepID=A0A0V1FE51_TRIPS|nr:hypothetical protein T4D_4685 [Trichinella pseudospiralis]
MTISPIDRIVLVQSSQNENHIRTRLCLASDLIIRMLTLIILIQMMLISVLSLKQAACIEEYLQHNIKQNSSKDGIEERNYS